MRLKRQLDSSLLSRCTKSPPLSIGGPYVGPPKSLLKPTLLETICREHRFETRVAPCLETHELYETRSNTDKDCESSSCAIGETVRSRVGRLVYIVAGITQTKIHKIDDFVKSSRI